VSRVAARDLLFRAPKATTVTEKEYLAVFGFGGCPGGFANSSSEGGPTSLVSSQLLEDPLTNRLYAPSYMQIGVGDLDEGHWA
jgi:hypothetical protein